VAWRLRPLYLESAFGPLYITAIQPADGRVRGAVVCVPPFAEEMNKSRRMLALLGQRLALQGYVTVIPDLAGTGESWGDFGDARLARWQSDLRQCVGWIEEQGWAVHSVLGLRFGALLVTDVLTAAGGANHLVLWQPVLNGADFLGQFLRLRVAAAMMRQGGGESVASLRAELAAGHPVEVSGYELHPELVAAVDTLQLADGLQGMNAMPIGWFQLGATADLSPATTRAVQGLVASGLAVAAAGVPGESFWNSTETVVNEELLTATVTFITGAGTIGAFA
jgi:exosortase A-associated hydrolase 2